MFSESEIDGEHVDVLLKQSCKDIQQGLCNLEMSLMRLVKKDEIDSEQWIATHECNIILLNLVKELNEILKEIKPSSKSLKMQRIKLIVLLNKIKKIVIN